MTGNQSQISVKEITIGIMYGIVSVLLILFVWALIAKSASALTISLFSLAVSLATFVLKLLVDVIWKPKLAIQFIQRAPDCHLIRERGVPGVSKEGRHSRYYFALRVWNHGKVKAENVKVKLTDLYRKLNDKWEPQNELNPDQLLWRLSGKAFEPTINPQTFEHCNLGYIIDPCVRQLIPQEFGENNPVFQNDPYDNIFHIQVSAPSTNLSYLLQPGIYKLGIEASCSNGEKTRKELGIDLKKLWQLSEVVMFREGIIISEVV